ncbi:PEP-CTERM sorting domain-containing protein [Adhaeretor mobilis]|uniref:PEP-CTERM protein-sorting domain-containing protein n=1 Tax=Adhaeretor mobilis TaxID=1930276 RepID=A0A517MWM3_9BACT|nr:PEP-CTERM sorting domain-containing protein [Adhaeretor mobilis]QDS99280.1 hypothetical protein HG15A2_26020 [Adhaeretor mobilis]
MEFSKLFVFIAACTLLVATANADTIQGTFVGATLANTALSDGSGDPWTGDTADSNGNGSIIGLWFDGSNETGDGTYSLRTTPGGNPVPNGGGFRADATFGPLPEPQIGSGQIEDPQIVTTVPGLAAGTYDVNFIFTAYGHHRGQNLAAGLSSTSMIPIPDNNTAVQDHPVFANGPLDEFESVRLNGVGAWQMPLGSVTLAAGDDLEVYVENVFTALFSTPTAYSGISYSLSGSGFAGDFDEDGDVDGADFLVWQRDPGVGSLADWQTNYGSAASSATATAVPEPTTGILLMLGTVSLLFRRDKDVS